MNSNSNKYYEYLENVTKLLSEKKISEEMAKDMLKSFNEFIQSVKEIEINHDNNVKEIELSRDKTQKEILQIRCTENGMKVTSMERAIKIADAVVVSCNTINGFGDPKPVVDQSIFNDQQPPLS